MHELLCLILELGYLTNKYIDEAKPWELVKNKQDTSIQVFLTYVLNNLRTLTIMLQPVLTKGSKLMIKSLNFTTKQLQYSTINDLSLIAKQQIKSQPKAIYQRH
jgi:methionyl-tRNA synthetase